MLFLLVGLRHHLVKAVLQMLEGSVLHFPHEFLKSRSLQILFLKVMKSLRYILQVNQNRGPKIPQTFCL